MRRPSQEALINAVIIIGVIVALAVAGAFLSGWYP
jgi:hypothetical protein